MTGGAPESATVKRRGILALYVKKSFDDSDETYGYRRVHADLAGWGVPAGPELVRSLMRELGLEPCQPRPWRFSLTKGDFQEHGIPDLVRRDFTAAAPGEKMVGTSHIFRPGRPSPHRISPIASPPSRHTRPLAGFSQTHPR